jgi:hypothetical protein
MSGDGCRWAWPICVLSVVLLAPTSVAQPTDDEPWPRHTIDSSSRAGDVDLDGRPDVVFTCENARDGKRGVMWLSRNGGGGWDAHDISGPEGVKYDLVELIDLDADGDLDALTCEESANLGVVWYENPTR